MSRLLVVSVLALLIGLSIAPAARADGCEEGGVTIEADGTIRVCGEAARPHAMYVLPRTRHERYVPELRRSATGEIVRDAERL